MPDHATRLPLVAILACLGLAACRTLPPEPDFEQRAAAAVRLGAYPEADAAALEARGDLIAALRLRRAIAQSRPKDARAHRELFRVGLAAGQHRRASQDAIDYVWLVPDRAAASEDVARLYLAARMPLPGIPWARRAIGYGGPAREDRIRLLIALAEAANDKEGASEARRALLP